MTLKTHIDAVKELYFKGAASDDRKISDKFIAHLLYVARATLLQQKLDKGKQLSENMYTTFVMDFIQSEFSGSQCATGTCPYRRSLYEITPPIMTKKGPALQVYNLNGETLDNTPIDTNRYAVKYSLAQKNSTAWFYHNGYIWLTNTKVVSKLLIKLISNGEQLQTESCAVGNTTCTYAYAKTFIDDELVEQLYAATVRLLSLRVRTDKMNNNTDDTQEDALGRPEITN